MRRAIAALVLIPLLLSGCARDTTSESPAAGVSSAASEEPQDDASRAPGGSAAPSGKVTVAKGSVAQTVNAVDATNATVDLVVSPLQVRDKLATLSVTFTPRYADAAPDESISLYDVNGGSPVYVSLVDTVGLRRYVVVEDSAGQNLGSDEVSTSATNGSSAQLSYTFAAPPEDLTDIDVQISDFPPFIDVPILR